MKKDNRVYYTLIFLVLIFLYRRNNFETFTDPIKNAQNTINTYELKTNSNNNNYNNNNYNNNTPSYNSNKNNFNNNTPSYNSNNNTYNSNEEVQELIMSYI